MATVVLLGRTTAGTTSDFISTSDRSAWEFTASATGNVKSIWLHPKVANGSMSDIEVGIYDDNGTVPGNLLGSTTVTLGINDNGPIVGNLSSSVAVVSGTQYWLAVQPATQNYSFQGDSGGAYSTDIGTSLPATWGEDGTGTINAILWGEDTEGIVYVGAGAVATGTGSLSPAIPTHAAGDLLVLAVGCKPDTSTINVPASWTQPTNGQAAGGGGTTGIDTGPTNAAIMYLEAAGPGTTVTVTFSGNNTEWAQVLVFRKPASTTWNVAAANGIDSTTGTPFTAAMGTDPGLAIGDALVVAGCIPTDVTTPAQFSAETVTGTGLTTQIGEVSEPDSSAGNDIGGVVCRGHVTAPLTSGVPTFSATAGGTTTNVRGPIILARLRANAAAAATSLIFQSRPSAARHPLLRR